MERRQHAGGIPQAVVAPAGYRYADQVGDELFVAGQVPVDADGELVGVGHAGEQAHQCLQNLATLVEQREFTTNDIHHLTVYVVGEREDLLDAWRAVTNFFDVPTPPTTLLGVALLGHPNQLVEVDARVVRVH